MNAVITGASRGIGKAIAIAFVREGFDLALCSRNEGDLKQTVKEIKNRFPKAEILAQTCDVADKKNVKQFARFVLSKWKKTDVLVNNAGIFLGGEEVHREEDGILEQVMATNLFGTYYMTRAFIDTMLKQKSGHIFNICSIAGITAYPNGGSYSISKFALYGFSKNLREEMKPHNIRVTTILPGAVWTDSWKNSGLPEKRFMKPEDIADTVVSAWKLSEQTVVEEIILRPQEGDI